MANKPLTIDKVKERVSNLTSGILEYVEDERFPYKNYDSQLLVFNNETNKYSILTMNTLNTTASKERYKKG